MIKNILLILLCAVTIQVYGQRHVCGVDLINNAGDEIYQGLQSNKSLIEKYGKPKDGQIIYIPIKFHILAEADGTGKMTFDNILGELCYLNEEFEDVGFRFYLKDGRVNYHFNTAHYNAPSTNSGLNYLSNRKDDDAVNIFITNSAGDREDVLVLGVYYGGGLDFIIIRKANFNSGDHTVTHELGHFFDLPHTFFGWENDPYDASVHGQQITQNTIGGRQIELVNRSNCNNSGDGICDTQSNYLFGLGYPSSCPPFSMEVFDKNGDAVVPDVNNYMSYFSGCDPYSFSQGQIDVMNVDYTRSNRSYIRSNYIPQDGNIDTQVQVYSPANNKVVDGYNEVILDWSDVPEAQSYYVKISGGGQQFEYFTPNSWLLVTDLAPSKFYSWKVTPWNETGGCANGASRLFRTPTTTATNEEAIVNAFSIGPNPISQNAFLKLNIDSKVTGNAKVELLSINGQLLKSQNALLQNGDNTIDFHIEQPTGLYLIKLTTEDGSALRKIIVN